MISATPMTASEWIVRLSGEPLSSAERQALAEWIASDATRLQELEEARAVWRLVARASSTPYGADQLSRSLEDIEKCHRQTRAKRRQLGLLGGLAVAASLMLMVTLYPSQPNQPFQLANQSNVETAVGEVQRYELPDASSVTVAADSVLAVNFTSLNRQISLNRGEVFLKVAHDQGRPFTVKAGTHSVIVTGTKFNVDFDSARDEIEVAVAEGSVDVRLSNDDGPVRKESLMAGDVVLFKSSGEIARLGITPEQAAAWRDGTVYFNEVSLRDALVQMNRYAQKPIVVGDSGIADLTLTGRFDARDTSAFIYALEAIFGIKARELDRTWELSLES